MSRLKKRPTTFPSCAVPAAAHRSRSTDPTSCGSGRFDRNAGEPSQRSFAPSAGPGSPSKGFPYRRAPGSVVSAVSALDTNILQRRSHHRGAVHVATGDDRARWLASPVDCQMHLGLHPAARAPDSLLWRLEPPTRVIRWSPLRCERGLPRDDARAPDLGCPRVRQSRVGSHADDRSPTRRAGGEGLRPPSRQTLLSTRPRHAGPQVTVRSPPAGGPLSSPLRSPRSAPPGAPPGSQPPGPPARPPTAHPAARR